MRYNDGDYSISINHALWIGLCMLVTIFIIIHPVSADQLVEAPGQYCSDLKSEYFDHGWWHMYSSCPSGYSCNGYIEDCSVGTPGGYNNSLTSGVFSSYAYYAGSCGYTHFYTPCIGDVTPTPTPTPSYSQCRKACGYTFSTSCNNWYGLYQQDIGDLMQWVGGCDLSSPNYATAALSCPCSNPDPSLVNTTPTPTAIIPTATPTPTVQEPLPVWSPNTIVYHMTTKAGTSGVWEAPTVVSKDSNITVANQTIYDSVNFSPITTINTSLPSWINENSYRDSLCVNQTNPAAQFVCPAINTFYNVVTFIDGIIYGFETIMLSPFSYFTNAWNWAFGLQENLLSAFAAQISIFVAIASQILNSFPPKVINAFSIFLVLNLIETVINGIRESGG